MKEAFEEAIGKKVELKVVEPEDLPAFFGTVFPPHVAPLFVEMNATLLPGSPILNDPLNDMPVHRGSDTLTDAIQRMVQ